MKKIVLATDIFGVTDHVMWLADEFSKVCDVTVADPYQGREVGITDEKVMYKYFLNNVGFDEYVRTLEAATHDNGPCTLLGFSAGASSGWRVVNKSKDIQSAILLYSGQIRKHLALNPACKCDLIFPAMEPSFDLDPVVEELSTKPLVNITRVTQLHGFMNKYSSNYDEEACIRYVGEIKNMLAD